MQYTNLRQEDGVTYITLTNPQKIDRTMTYVDGQFTFQDAQSGQTITMPAASNCVAVDVTQPYHQIDAPVSTGNVYRHCYPSVVNGEVSVIYYTTA